MMQRSRPTAAPLTAHRHARPAPRGRKRIVAPDGSEIVPSNKPRAHGAPVKTPARAWRWPKAAEGEMVAVRGPHSALERLSGVLLGLLLVHWNIVGPPSVSTGMIGASIGLLVAAVLLLCGLCVVVTAAAWLPDLPPPAS